MADACGWDSIHAWVQAHRDALPTTLTALARYPLAYRAAIQAAVAPDVRLSLWREHFESFLTPASTLTAPQQAFVRTTLLELPKLFASDRLSAQDRARELESRLAGVFTREEAARVFAQLGPDEPPGGIRAPL